MGLIYNYMTDEMDYKLIEHQIIESKPCKIEMTKPLNALIMTDRLFGGAFGLYRFFTNCTDIEAKIVCDSDNVKELMKYIKFDIVIFVGYLKNKKNYDVINLINKASSDSKIIMFANIDDVITAECKKYEIEYMFNRYNKMTDFLKFINEIF